MTTRAPVDLARRDTLRWTFGLSLGTVLPPLTGCVGDGGWDATEDTLPAAPMLAAKDGKLNLDLIARYSSQPLTIAMSQDPAYPQPTIVMRPGEVQNWHFVNSASFYPFNPVLDDHTLLNYAKDGSAIDQKFKPIDKATSTQFGNQQWPGNAIYPGGRHSVIVKASDVPGTYYLRSVQAPFSEPKDEIVARIVVEGVPMSTPLPSPANLPRYADHLPITDEELASHGGKQRNLVLAILGKTNNLLALPIPPGEDWFIPESDGVPDFTDQVFASGSVGSKLSPFQSSLTVTQMVALNAVEEWTIENMNAYPHPFHIHINDSYVVKVNGEAVAPFWADTLPVPPVDNVTRKNGSITFRMRFTDFHGKYVWHCHALDHEDLGMRQLSRSWNSRRRRPTGPPRGIAADWYRPKRNFAVRRSLRAESHASRVTTFTLSFFFRLPKASVGERDRFRAAS